MTQLVITGASGQLGRRAAEIALGTTRADQLILVTRNPSALEGLAERGVTVRHGDFDEPQRLGEAFAGGGRLLLISATDLARRGEQHRAAIQAAVAAGIEHVIYTSMLEPDPANPAVVAPSHRLTEQALEDSGIGWTLLRNSLYSDYQVPEAARAIATGKLVHNRGGGRVAYVAREDCAAVAAAVLTGNGHEGKTYDVTGPELFDAGALAALYGELGATNVEAIALDDAAFIESLVGAAAGGNDDHARYGAELVASFGRSVREGYLASCTEVVRELTGRPPLSLRQVLLAKWPASRN